jgi:hypothetical protein
VVVHLVSNYYLFQRNGNKPYDAIISVELLYDISKSIDQHKNESKMIHKLPCLDQQTYQEKNIRLGNLCHIENNVLYKQN